MTRPANIDRPRPEELAGSAGTTILTGHRDTHFRFLERLREGDEMRLMTHDRHPHRYRVRSMTVVDARSASIRQDRQKNHLVLVT